MERSFLYWGLLNHLKSASSYNLADKPNQANFATHYYK